MADEQSNATQADADAQSQADTPLTASDGDTQAESHDTAALDDLKKVRSEASNLRKRLKDAESRLAQFEQATQSDDEKRAAALKAAEERATAAESRYRAAIGRAAVSEAATKQGAIDSTAVYALIRDGIDFDDDGEPTNVDDLLAQTKKQHPALFRAAAGSADGGKTNGDTKPDLKGGFDRLVYGYETNSKTARRR